MSEILKVFIETNTTTNQQALNDWLRSLSGVAKAYELKEVDLELKDEADIADLRTKLRQCPFAVVVGDCLESEMEIVGLTEEGLAAIAGETGDVPATQTDMDTRLEQIAIDLGGVSAMTETIEPTADGGVFRYNIRNEAGEVLATGTELELFEKSKTEPAGAEPVVPPKESGATVSINGGPKVDALSEEGQAILKEAGEKAAEAAAAGEPIMVSINDGQAYAVGSPELEAELEKLKTPEDTEQPAADADNSQPKTESEGGAAADTTETGDAEPQAGTQDGEPSADSVDNTTKPAA